MKPKGLGDLCAATSDLANQTGIEKNRSFDQQAKLDILSFQKSYEWAMETRGPKLNFVQAFMPILVTSNFDDDSIKNEWAGMETPYVKCFRPQGELTP